VPPLVYAVLGSSRDIAIGPVAVVSLLLGTLLRKEINGTKHPTEYLQLAFTATFFAGVFQTGLGVFRLGFVIQFLSHAAIVGFMAGAAVTIGLQQLKGLLNIANFTTKTDFISVMKSVFGEIDQVRNPYCYLHLNSLLWNFFLRGKTGIMWVSWWAVAS